ncbi:MAG TPA: O-acetyl-ADP-ribose deacetylase [Flavobacteriaceae bacterium]|nr:O-acetyl-ADP-ribose deacetylase [Flavobacteriaceae bacterium]
MKMEVVKGDITYFEGDAIVNAANSSLLGGGGVDGAIHRAGGPEILEACKEIVSKIGSLPTGEAVTTTAGKMRTKYVIHTVGPVWKGGTNDEAQKLANCYKNSLLEAIKYGCKTVAFPNISTGVYGYPKEEAAKIAVTTIHEFIKDTKAIEKVTFMCFDDENYQLIQRELAEI